MLELSGVDASYGETQVLYDVDLRVDETEAVAVLGPNGAGKTTLLRTISGALAPADGTIEYGDEAITGLAPYTIAERGIAHVPQEHAVFTDMSILDNLLVGSYLPSARDDRDASLEFVFDRFPRLEERQEQLAGTLSGGERKMLAIAKGLMSKPDLLLLDEPSSGLAPTLVDEVFEGITEIRDRTGMPILLVEQRVVEALGFADRVYVIENGRILASGTAEEIRETEDFAQAYLGI